jgi:hypothetical protein
MKKQGSGNLLRNKRILLITNLETTPKDHCKNYTAKTPRHKYLKNYKLIFSVFATLR